MSYDAWDFIETIRDALQVGELPGTAPEDPSDIADLCLERIEAMNDRLRSAFLVLDEIADLSGLLDKATSDAARGYNDGRKRDAYFAKGEADELRAFLAGKAPRPSRRQKAERAYVLLQQARELLREAGASRALDKLRKIMPSCQGAVRAARMRDTREERAVS